MNAVKVGRTERFDIFKVRVERDQNVGAPRDVYMAWFHGEDFPRPACVVTVWPPYSFVEWVQVDELRRRQGVATEVMTFLISEIKGLEYEGETPEGEALCEKLDRIRGGGSATNSAGSDTESPDLPSSKKPEPAGT